MNKSRINWSQFRKLNPYQRIEFLLSHHIINQSEVSNMLIPKLSTETANQIVENTLSTFSLPYALVPDVLIDGINYNIPFVTEEPSVVAAANYATGIIKRSGGFKTSNVGRLMTGQVVLYNILNPEQAKSKILSHTSQILQLANEAYPSIVKRGGGARALSVEIKENFLSCYLSVDTKEAMGANMMNTMLEALKPYLEELTSSKVLMAILSNYSLGTLTTAKCSIQLRHLHRDETIAKSIAQKIALATQFAKIDTYRATTHNKGILNGIDAVVLATGNDWRAIEAACHAYASHNGSYEALSTWTFNESNSSLDGELTLPMPIATKGGSIGLNPTVQLSHVFLKEVPAKKLAEIIVSIGLSQNFAALKALVTDGIQSGHMKLQAKSLILLAGATEDEVNDLIPLLLQQPILNIENAKNILDFYRSKK